MSAASTATRFPLRWESTGDQWWFASPIDWAAANGHYDVVRELLHIDPNLLIKLTSLPRIKRLETVWDDLEKNSNKMAQSRSSVAKNLYRECEAKKGHNSLIKAGYGGWLLYTAASAGDSPFVKELLERDPTLVFGEGEYGVTDIFYAAARSRCSEVFKAVFDCSLSFKEAAPVFKREMKNRALHSLARGGNVELLNEFLRDFGGDVLSFRDAQGSTVLHSAAATGQFEVVEHLITSYDDIIASADNQGNTALHVAAYRGHIPVFNLLISSSSPSLASSTNNNGDTVLHMAVSGFSAPTFRRLDQQLNLVDRLVNGNNLLSIDDIINVQNKDGRTPLHLAVMGNVQSEVVELLMSARYIDVNIRDSSGKTPLSLLKQKPNSSSSEILIKRMISAGGILSAADSQDLKAREALVSCLKIRGIRASPGTSFEIPDAEIFLYAGIDDFAPSSCGYSGEIELRKRRHFNLLLRWAGKKDEQGNSSEDECSVESFSCKESPASRNPQIPLRQQYLGQQASSLPSNKRVQSFMPSPLSKRKFAEGLRQGVLRVLTRSPSRTFSESTMSCLSSPRGGAEVSSSCDQSPDAGKKLNRTARRNASLNLRLMNNYLCFGAQGLGLQKGDVDVDSPPRSPNVQGRQ